MNRIAWEEEFVLLKQYKERVGHRNVPTAHQVIRRTERILDSGFIDNSRTRRRVFLTTIESSDLKVLVCGGVYGDHA